MIFRSGRPGRLPAGGEGHQGSVADRALELLDNQGSRQGIATDICASAS